MLILSSLDRDREWSVRASLATILGTLPPETARPAILELVTDPDVRVHGPALEALARVGAPDLGKRLFDALEAPDVHVRATAARLMGEQKTEGGAARLAAAYSRAENDPSYVARAAAIEALAKSGADAARETLTRALADRDWPVRLRAAELLRGLGEPAAVPNGLRPSASRSRSSNQSACCTRSSPRRRTSRPGAARFKSSSTWSTRPSRRGASSSWRAPASSTA